MLILQDKILRVSTNVLVNSSFQKSVFGFKNCLQTFLSRRYVSSASESQHATDIYPQACLGLWDIQENVTPVIQPKGPIYVHMTVNIIDMCHVI